MKQNAHPTISGAVKAARQFARQGPRVAAILQSGRSYYAVPGYIDTNKPGVKQIRLITPDGKIWKPA